MKVYTKLGTMIAAVITGFNNGIVITADDLLDVGHDWLTMNTPQVGDLIIHQGGGHYGLMRAGEAEFWTEDDSVPEPGSERWVITDGAVWMNPKGGKTKSLANAKSFDSEDTARDSFLDNEMPDGFHIELLDTPA
jgi:hypothetical protein